MDTRSNKYIEENMSRVKKNNSLYKEINNSAIDNFDVSSNATVIGEQNREIDVEQIKRILDKRYNDTPKRRSIRVEPQEVISRLKEDDTKEYDLTKVLEKARDEKKESYEESRAKKLRNTQFDILNNLNIEKEENGETPEDNLINLINTITINEAKMKETSCDPLDILTDLKGSDDTQVYEKIEEVTSITEIKEKDNEKEDLENSFYDDENFKKKDFVEDEDDFLDDDKLSIGIKILIVLVIVVFVVGSFLFLKSFFKF